MTICLRRVDPKPSCFSWKWRELSGCTVLQPSGWATASNRRYPRPGILEGLWAPWQTLPWDYFTFTRDSIRIIETPRCAP